MHSKVSALSPVKKWHPLVNGVPDTTQPARTRVQLNNRLQSYLIGHAQERTVQPFLDRFPVVLTDQSICNNMLVRNDCYHGLQMLDMWNTMAKTQDPGTLLKQWVRCTSTMALAYKVDDETLRHNVDWPRWNYMVGRNPYLPRKEKGDSDDFAQCLALMVIATKIDSTIAPIVCAQKRLIAPLDQLEPLVGSRWTNWEKAQYATLVETCPPRQRGDPYGPGKDLTPVRDQILAWKDLVAPSQLAPLHLLLSMDIGWFEASSLWLTTIKNSATSMQLLDYTVGLDDQPTQ